MFQNRTSLFAFLLVVLWFFWSLMNHFPANVLSWDVYGAYLHLPANFIYNDPFLTDWQWIESMNEKYNATPTYYQFWTTETGRQIIKYPLGFSVIYAPFFFVGHLLAPLFNYPQDGFSMPYQYAIVFGHCVYVVLGLWFTRKMLKRFFSDNLTAVLMLILFAGTNFYFTSTTMVAMPHGHLLMFYALVVLFTIKIHENPNTKNSVLLGLTIGLAALIRATEILLVLIPLLWHIVDRFSVKEKWQWIIINKKFIFQVATSIFVVGLIQLVYYKLASGKFFVDAYNNPGEGFDFLSPYTFDFLFSARKGWLVYTPIMILALMGLWFLYRHDRKVFTPIFIFTLLNIYLLSSWTCWWYAESFGQRSIVQSYPLLLIPMGFTLQKLSELKSKSVAISIYAVVTLLVAFNQFQTWQMHKGLLHPSRMTAAAYHTHFLKTTPHPDFEKMLLVDKSVPAHERLLTDSLVIKQQLQFQFNGENWEQTTFGKPWNHRGVEVNESRVYSKDLVANYQTLTKQKNVILLLEAQVFFDGDIQEILPRIVFKMRHKGRTYYDQYVHVEQAASLEENQWNKISYVFYSTDVRNMKKDEIQIFAWLAGKGSFKMDDVVIKVYEGLN